MNANKEYPTRCILCNALKYTATDMLYWICSECRTNLWQLVRDETQEIVLLKTSTGYNIQEVIQED